MAKGAAKPKTAGKPLAHMARPEAVPSLPRAAEVTELFDKLVRLVSEYAKAMGRNITEDLAKIAVRIPVAEVDEFGMEADYRSRAKPLMDFLYDEYFRVEAIGLDEVPGDGRVCLVSNHSGLLPYDALMIGHAIEQHHPSRRLVRALVDDLFMVTPWFSKMFSRLGLVRACQENAERLLQQDNVVAVFPEGIKGIGKLYRHRYQLQRFGRGGFIKLAFKTNTPIIPTAVMGAEEIHPMVGRVTWLAEYLGIPYVPVTPTFPWLGPLGALPLPSKWRIRLGEPIDLVAQYGPRGHEDRVLVNKLTEQVRSTIQGLVDDCLSRRSSVLFG